MVLLSTNAEAGFLDAEAPGFNGAELLRIGDGLAGKAQRSLR